MLGNAFVFKANASNSAMLSYIRDKLIHTSSGKKKQLNEIIWSSLSVEHCKFHIVPEFMCKKT